ncbi:MAG: hypothetical protein U1D06_04700 [Paracoccaceae bacterium]|nr:hypothetical protein [Paracoccaceae bacterium]
MIGDVIEIALALSAVQASQRLAMLDDLLQRAHCADRIRKRLCRPHAIWGNGTLTGAVGAVAKMPEPFLSDPDYLDSIGLVMDCLNKRLRRHLQRNSSTALD